MKRNKDKPLGKQMSKLEKLRQQVGGLEILETGLEFAESEIRESGEKYQRLFELSPMGIVVLDMKGVITACNSAVCTQSGYSKDDFIGKHFSKVATIRAGDIPKFMKTFASLIRGKIPKPLEVTYTRKDGTTGWTETHISLLKSGGKRIGIQVIQNDITERKRAEETLKASEEKYKQLAESISDVFFAFDEELRYTYWNKASEELIGISARDALGKHLYDIFPRDGQTSRAEKAYLKALRTKQPQHFINEYQLGGKDFAFEISAYPSRSGLSVFVKDITERKQAEEALRESEQNFRNSLDSSPLGIRIVTAEGELLYANQAILDIYGYSSVEELKAVPTKQRYTPKSYAEHQERKERRKLAKPGPASYEISIVRKDGEVRHLRVFRREVVWNGETQFQSLYQDITERKRAEEALERSETKYRGIVETTGSGVATIDSNGVFTFVNKSLCNMIGYSDDELVGAPFLDFLHPDDRTSLLDRFQSALEGRLLRKLLEFRVLHRDGAILWWQSAPTPIFDGKEVLGFSAIIYDITEQKRAEAELRESEERYRALVNLGATVGEAIVMLQDNERGQAMHIFVSTEWPRVTGYSRKELLGISFVDLLHPRHRAASLKRHGRKMQGEIVPGLFEMSIIRKDGTEVPIEVTSAYTTYKGEPANVAFIRDITERKQAEEREKQLQQELHLASRLATVGEMASGIAHEINNPLTGVIGFANLLMKKDLPEDIKKDVRIIYDGAQRVGSITNRMLTFARQHRSDRASVNINDIVETTLAMRAYEASSSGIKVTTKLSTDIPLTFIDASQLQQVFLNIIINAEVEMITAHGKGNLSVKTERIDNTIRVSFKDDGPGIPKKNLDKIFDPFFTTREVGQGTGLGLSVCHGIVTQHGGKIYARSTLGKGATFFVELPIITKAEQ